MPDSRHVILFNPETMFVPTGGTVAPVLAQHSKSFSLIDCISVGGLIGCNVTSSRCGSRWRRSSGAN
jgi:hypothetical protein